MGWKLLESSKLENKEGELRSVVLFTGTERHELLRSHLTCEAPWHQAPA